MPGSGAVELDGGVSRRRATAQKKPFFSNFAGRRIAIVHNVDPEHLDHFKNSLERWQGRFSAFSVEKNLPVLGSRGMLLDPPGGWQSFVVQIEDRMFHQPTAENPAGLTRGSDRSLILFGPGGLHLQGP